MVTYDLTPDQIVDWAFNYASYEELELTAKTLYGLYVEERKRKYPEAQKANKKAYMRRKRSGKK